MNEPTSNDKGRAAPLAKSSTGISGFDQLTGGGLPVERTTLLLGGSGSGKTVFALQTLVSAARRGEPGLFVSFSEPPRQIIQNGAGFGWNLDELEKGRLIFLDAQMRPSLVRAGQFDLTGLLAGLRAVATDMGARRIVFDSLDVLLTLLDDRISELQEIFRLRDWLIEHGFTALITANLGSGDGPQQQRHAFVQSIADCTIALDFRKEGRQAARGVRVLKYRGSGFVHDEFPFTIGGEGIEVLLPAPNQAEAQPPGFASALQGELAQAREKFEERLAEFNRFFEIKQAELEFQARKRAPRRAQSTRPKPRAKRG